MASSYLWTCRSTCTGEGGGGVVKYGNLAIISGSRALEGEPLFSSMYLGVFSCAADYLFYVTI